MLDRDIALEAVKEASGPPQPSGPAHAHRLLPTLTGHSLDSGQAIGPPARDNGGP
jgi:hypothetical protein